MWSFDFEIQHKNDVKIELNIMLQKEAYRKLINIIIWIITKVVFFYIFTNIL